MQTFQCTLAAGLADATHGTHEISQPKLPKGKRPQAPTLPWPSSTSWPCRVIPLHRTRSTIYHNRTTNCRPSSPCTAQKASQNLMAFTEKKKTAHRVRPCSKEEAHPLSRIGFLPSVPTPTAESNPARQLETHYPLQSRGDHTYCCPPM